MKKSLRSQKLTTYLNLLISIRKEKGFTQLELAEKLQKPQSFVSKYESGERRLDILELQAICAVLEIPLTTFVQKLEKNL